MKILCLSDDIDPLLYSDYMKERFSDIDIILAAGDLSIDYYEFILTTLNKPLYFIFGNHHLKMFNYFKNPSIRHYFQDYTKGYGAQCIDGEMIKIKRHSLLVMGLGGSRRYNRGESQYSELQMTLFIMKAMPRLLFNRLIYGRFLDLFLTHSPPYQIGDRDDLPHQGFKIFRWFLYHFKPRYMLHGHVHLQDTTQKRHHFYRDTQIINCYNHYILEI